MVAAVGERGEKRVQVTTGMRKRICQPSVKVLSVWTS
mgnify:CR=1 FL=1